MIDVIESRRVFQTSSVVLFRCSFKEQSVQA